MGGTNVERCVCVCVFVCRRGNDVGFGRQARFWMQVIGELRMGVKLKKVSHSRTPIEYELTPYEILMDDIRSRRYTLRKVDSSIPHNVKKDAHAMILEFIRSRPPLKKASERQLPPAKRETTPREQLLRSIRLGRPLRPTPRVNIERRKSEAKVRRRRVSPAGGRSPDEPPLDVAQHKAYWGSVARARPRTEASGSVSGGGSEDRRAGSDVTRRTSGDVTPHKQPQRRLIKVDFDNLEDDEDDEETQKCASPPRPLPRHSAPPKPWKRTDRHVLKAKVCTLSRTPDAARPDATRCGTAASRPRVPPRARLSHDEYHQFCDETLECTPHAIA
ncbi:unnamed protein product [Pieris macdunnoughi]|uniref:Uncharacterized protein n=1 Tax=Pieris macdunnoughi TaxID=345717 RepID=A0A821Y894_9NEOP|nr:unnamed protein product [Pieris macdunnoughi]